jgi:hypothetical protein
MEVRVAGGGHLLLVLLLRRKDLGVQEFDDLLSEVCSTGTRIETHHSLLMSDDRAPGDRRTPRVANMREHHALKHEGRAGRPSRSGDAHAEDEASSAVTGR